MLQCQNTVAHRYMAIYTLPVPIGIKCRGSALPHMCPMAMAHATYGYTAHTAAMVPMGLCILYFALSAHRHWFIPYGLPIGTAGRQCK